LAAFNRNHDDAATRCFVNQIQRVLGWHEFIGSAFQHGDGRSADALVIDARLDIAGHIATYTAHLVHRIGNGCDGNVVESFNQISHGFSRGSQLTNGFWVATSG
jgi:hypothetical protein